MRSDKNQFGPSSRNSLPLKHRIVCHYCHDTVIGGTSRTVLDDSRSLAITAWTCARCGGGMEEIYILTQDGKARPRPIRYFLAPLLATKRSAAAHREIRN